MNNMGPGEALLLCYLVGLAVVFGVPWLLIRRYVRSEAAAAFYEETGLVPHTKVRGKLRKEIM